MEKVQYYNDSDYIQVIVSWLKKREAQSMEYKGQSPQIQRRRHLVDWTSIVGEKLHLTNSTVHLAVKILDYFMDGHDIQDPQLYLVCLVSLLLAAKMEEKEKNVPKCSVLNSFTEHKLPLNNFVSLEVVILKYFNWNLCLPTACSFTELWVPYSVHPTDLHNNGPLISFREAQAYFQQYVKHFLQLVMQESAFVDTLPSLLGASLLAAARISFGLTPTWSKRVELITGYALETLQPFVEVLLSSFSKDVCEETDISMDDEGYLSSYSPLKGTNVPRGDQETDPLNCSECTQNGGF